MRCAPKTDTTVAAVRFCDVCEWAVANSACMADMKREADLQRKAAKWRHLVKLQLLHIVVCIAHRSHIIGGHAQACM